jgi:tartrate dehydratase beta subunit/fumarate hydratase class I family protein
MQRHLRPHRISRRSDAGKGQPLAGGGRCLQEARRLLLASIGGAAVNLAEHCIEVEALEYPELGMEAIWRIEVEKFPAFIVIDDKGNDFYADIASRRPELLRIG